MKNKIDIELEAKAIAEEPEKAARDTDTEVQDNGTQCQEAISFEEPESDDGDTGISDNEEESPLPDSDGEEEFIFDGEDAPSFELIEDAGGEDTAPPAEQDTPEVEKAEGDNDAEAITEGEEQPTVPEKKQKKERTVGTRRIDTAFDFLELFIFTLVGVLIVTSFLFRHSVVSGDSMQNTLQNDDRLIISDLFYEPEYGDIVVVEDRTAGMETPIVKRVIATEGQTVRVERDGISVDGVKLTEDYVFTDGFNYYYDLDPFAFADNETLVEEFGKYYEFVVPEGEIFVLGDHRNDSRDSRYYGTVREDAVLGRLILKFYPFDEFEFYLFED